MISKTLSVVLLLSIAVFVLLVLSGVIYVNIAIGISMQPFIETSAIVVGVCPELYYKYLAEYLGYNLTGKMIVYTAFGEQKYINLQTNEVVTIHFAIPTPIAHQVYVDKGDYLIVRGLNNNVWAEMVPRDKVDAIVLVILDTRLGLAILYIMGVVTTLAVLKVTDKI